MKIISIFNNKGGVGKTTLAYHLSCALSEMGQRVLMIDLDPQCNLTLFGISEENLFEMWHYEDDFIDDFENAKNAMSQADFKKHLTRPHTIHFLLKPVEDGLGEFEQQPPVIHLRPNLDLIPGRLTVNQYEAIIADRWSDVYRGDPLAIRTITKIRSIAEDYAQRGNYDYVIIDTSPSLGVLNKTIISTVDGFLIPALPDMFSLYGIRNIGNSLKVWKREFDIIYSILSEPKRNKFPQSFVRFLGYTIYNAKKYSGTGNPWDLAIAHYGYAQQIPEMIRQFIPEEVREHLSDDFVKEPIGGVAVMHTHNTLPASAQKYKCPIWAIPDQQNLDAADKNTVRVNRDTSYYPTKDKYHTFATSFIERVGTLD